MPVQTGRIRRKPKLSLEQATRTREVNEILSRRAKFSTKKPKIASKARFFTAQELDELRGLFEHHERGNRRRS